MSVAFDARWDRLDDWGHVLCFSKSHGKQEPTDMIRIFNRRNTQTLTLKISNGPRREYQPIDATDCIAVGKRFRFLCTVSSYGHMRIVQDAALIAEHHHGWAPCKAVRDRLLVGTYSEQDNETFQGFIDDVYVWNSVKSWEDIPVGPVVRFEGHRFPCEVAGNQEKLEICDGFRGDFEGSFSIAFQAEWDHVNNWSTIICFASSQSSGDPVDAIRVFGRAGTRTLTFQISHGPWKNYRRVDARDCITPGEVHTYLCSVTAGGYMQIHKDGVLAGTEPNGWAPRLAVRDQLLVGRCSSSWNATFSGSIIGLKAWNEEVPWEDLPTVHGDASRGPNIEDTSASAKKFRQAAGRNDVRCMEQMFRNRSLLHAADRGGKAALHYASREGAGEAVRRLLSWNADPNMADCNGGRPLDEAEWWSVKRPEKAKDYSSVLEALQMRHATHSRVHLRERRPVLQRWAEEHHLCAMDDWVRNG